MRFLLDTNAVIALFNKRLTSSEPARASIGQVSDIGLSASVAYELFYGAFKSQRQGHNLRRVELIGFPLVPLDRAAARAGR